MNLQVQRGFLTRSKEKEAKIPFDNCKRVLKIIHYLPMPYG